MSGEESGRGSSAVVGRVVLGVLMLVVLVLILFVRPGGDADTAKDAEPTTTGPTPVMPTATPTEPPREEAFCTSYRNYAATQGEYAAEPDGTGADLLREAADDLLATGIPVSMTTAARSGFFIELSAVYSSIGLQLDERAIPGAFEGDAQAEDPATAFGTFLETYCPAW